MPLFGGHKDKGIERLFIEIPDQCKGAIAYKWPDQQIVRHSVVNVDLDYAAVFTNLGHVIGVLGPGRHSLDQGASLTFGWLVDRLTGNAYYDAELYFITTRDITGQKFGGPVDNLTDGPSGLVVTLRVFGDLAFKVSDPTALLARLTGTGALQSYTMLISEWVSDQALAAIRAVLPDIVRDHGVLAMGQLQDATAAAATAKANGALAGYGVQITTFAQLNVNLPDADAEQLKQLGTARAYSDLAGDFTVGVRGAATLEMARGVEEGHVGANPALVAAGLLGTPLAGAPFAPAVNGPTASAPAGAPVSPGPGGPARFCSQCGVALAGTGRFCPGCGTAVAGQAPVAGAAEAAPAAPAPAAAPAPPANESAVRPPGPGWWMASDGRWYPPQAHPGPA